MRLLNAFSFLLVGFCLSIPLARSASAQGGEEAVVTAQVIERPATESKRFVANIMPHRRATIGSAVDGRVLEYPIDAGEPVTAEQPLARLRTGTVEIDLASAKAELSLRRAELEELENGSRPEEIALAEAQLQAAQADAQYAAARFQRMERLYRESAGLSQDEYEASRAEAMRTEAAVAERQSQLELARQGPREEQIAQARANVAVQEQAVALIEDRLEKFTVRSPFDGFVSQELTEQGAWILQGQPIAEVVEVNPVEVEVYVPESNIRFVSVGEECEVRVEAFPNESFIGTIDRIVPVADERSRSFPVRVVVPNPPVDGRHRLLPGMLAQISLATGATRRAKLVPKDALRLGDDPMTVVKLVDGKAVYVPVETGVAVGGLLQVTPLDPESLQDGDQVVVRGNERVRPGQSVRVLSSLDSTTMLDPESPGSEMLELRP